MLQAFYQKWELNRAVEAWNTGLPWPKFVIIFFVTMPLWLPFIFELFRRLELKAGKAQRQRARHYSSM